MAFLGMLNTLDRYRDIGILLLRIGLGITFIIHGAPKLFGGPEVWTNLGTMTGMPLPAFFGFMAAFAEFGGGILLIVGFLVRPATVLLFITMVVATMFHIGNGDGFSGFAHPLELAIVFGGMFLIGAGKYSLDAYLDKSASMGTLSSARA